LRPGNISSDLSWGNRDVVKDNFSGRVCKTVKVAVADDSPFPRWNLGWEETNNRDFGKGYHSRKTCATHGTTPLPVSGPYFMGIEMHRS
jgi:hypothetical protein